MTTVKAWERMMAETITAHEDADYVPGNVGAPGSGNEGADPLGLHYADLGPLAFVLNEAMDAAVNTGTDRDVLLEQIAQAAGEGISARDAEDVLTDNEHCPPIELLEAFATVLAIDATLLTDASVKGGCTNIGSRSTGPPPGF
jgi:hypothetical protein